MKGVTAHRLLTAYGLETPGGGLEGGFSSGTILGYVFRWPQERAESESGGEERPC